ncbi:phage minor capsid protein [Paenibacillus luteus]|uniref:phage minor capsid protein n=1 Tax=Paenibacillus luteus TaxID=2545753 RepID=UPI0011445555|nr:phage minor capsid protein [Paenibacillus luteus]
MTDKRPDYEDDVKDITGAFGGAVDDIKRELERMPLDRRGANAATKKVGAIIKSLTGKAGNWVDRVIPKAAKEGISRALGALGIGKKKAEPPVSRANSGMISAASEDTYADLLAVTKNIDRRTKAAIRRAVADTMRANIEAGINGRRTINADTAAKIRAELGASADNAIIDAAGRRWKVETYVDMVTRTKLMQATNDATINEALGRGVLYGVISRHGATDACAKWEGRTVKLVRDAPGSYPFIGDLPRREIFHPNCRHTISPIRNPLPEELESPFRAGSNGGDSNGEDYPDIPITTHNRVHGLADSTDKIIRNGEEQLRPLDYERGIIYDSKGNKLWEQSGEQRRLNIKEVADRGLLKDNIITHNHPDGFSFSRADLGVLVNYGVKEMRATSGPYLHRVSLGNSKVTLNEILSSYSELESYLDPLLRTEVKSGRIGIREGSTIFYHEIVKRLAVQYNLNYTRERL